MRTDYLERIVVALYSQTSRKQPQWDKEKCGTVWMKREQRKVFKTKQSHDVKSRIRSMRQEMTGSRGKKKAKRRIRHSYTQQLLGPVRRHTTS
jgi:hypothetical protein